MLNDLSSSKQGEAVGNLERAADVVRYHDAGDAQLITQMRFTRLSMMSAFTGSRPEVGSS